MDQFKARPTIYNGIQMRSRLEARVAAWLDKLGVKWVYEPAAFASSGGQYLPDFELLAAEGSFAKRRGYRTFLEVKGDLVADVRLVERTWAQMEIVTTSLDKPTLLLADASGLERGWLFAYNFPRLGVWEEILAVEFLYKTGMLELCDHWRLPRWNE